MKKLLIALSLITYLSSLISIVAQNVGINTNGSKPDPTAMLDVNDTAKGFLIPRLTTAQMNRIAFPAPGLQVFNTSTNCIEYYNGASWQNVVCPCTSAPSTPGVISGNAAPCSSSAGNVYTIAAVTGANSYTWSVPSGAAITAGAGTTSVTVTFGTTSGNINVTAINSCGISGASTLAIALNTIPATPAVPSGNTLPTVSTSDTYTIAPVSGAAGYTWSVSTANGSVSSGQGTTSATINFSGTAATMNICVYDSNVCGNSAASCLPVTTSTCVVTHGTATYTYTGGQQTWVVPSCITTITIECWGAQGGSYSGNSQTGGAGGYAIGNLSVTPTNTLYVYVGGQGTSATNSVVGGAGFNGGGNANGSGGGGGGESDVRAGGSSFADAVIIAGGGGGTAWDGDNPGAGGGTSGGAGGTSGNSASTGGGGGSQTAGGAGGSPAGGAGSAGQGGQGGNTTGIGYTGGGGGGYYGGGGGGADLNYGQGYGAPGGGGSGYTGGVSGGSMQTGIRNGNGQVVIHY